MGNIRGGMNGFLGTVGQPTAQVIDGSLKFDSASSQYLSSTSTFQNSKSYEMTFSFWLKRCAPTAVKATQYILKTNQEGTIFFDNDNSDQLAFNLRGSSGTNFFTYTSAKLRDYNAWYHVVVALNLGSGTQSQRFKCYINNVEQTMTNTSYPSNAYHTGGTWYIGSYNGSSHYPDYYLSNFYCISGQVLDPSYFGFTDPQTNTWRPKKYTGTFTFDNSFYLPLDNEDDFGQDKSGEGNHFTQNNFSGTSIDPDVVKDSPSGAVFGGRAQTGITTTSSAPSNYCTWNPLTTYAGANYTLSDGNLKAVKSGGNVVSLNGTIGVSFGDGGKFYYEADHNSSPTQGQGIGWGNDQYFTYAYGTGFTKRLFYKNTTVTFSEHDVSGTNIATGLVSNFGKTLGVAFDLDENTMSFYVDGALQATATGVWGTHFDTTDRLFPFLLGDGTGNNGTIETNFGQKPFKYAPPQGYLPLNSASVRPNTVVPRPDQYVGITTWTGDGTNNRVIQAPIDADFAWIKFRNQSYSHSLYDTVRGNNKRLVSNSTGTEGTVSFSFLNDKNIQISGASDTSQNDNNEPLVGWFWRAGGNKNTFNVDDVGYASAAAAGLDGGTMTVTGSSVGTKQGFSIVTYTGTNSNESIPHGLDSAPSFYIVKARQNSSYTDFWSVYHQSLGKDAYIKLNSTDAASTSSNIWNNTSPTDSLFYVRSDSIANENNINYVAYLWHDVPGLQKFGSYVATGGNTGPVINCGFRPSLVMVKRSSSGDDYTSWSMFDTERDPYNAQNRVSGALYANKNAPENRRGNASTEEGRESINVHLLSYGFQLMYNGAEINGPSSTTYIYAAWAEAPAYQLVRWSVQRTLINNQRIAIILNNYNLQSNIKDGSFCTTR